MPKRVKLTDKVRRQIEAAVGTDIDLDRIAVYESVAASTRPIHQMHSIYDQARMTKGMLDAMADWLTQESVPIQTMHGTHELPDGKVIQASVIQSGENDYDLRTMFYVQDGTDISSKIDLGIVDEVSVGVMSKHARCSSCGYDYFKDDDSMLSLLASRTCENEHTLGDNGVHLVLDGVERWQELSLVNKGASSKPKIVGDSEQLLASETFKKLAARGVSPVLYMLHASASNGEHPMNLEELLKKIGEQEKLLARSEVAQEKLQADLDGSQSKLAELEAQVTSLNEQIATLSESDKDAKVVELQASLDEKSQELEQLKAQDDAVMAYLSIQYKAGMVAAGLEAKEEATAAEMIEGLQQAQVKLAAIPRKGAITEGNKNQDFAVRGNAAAFRTHI